jgi:hypothetical protein
MLGGRVFTKGKTLVGTLNTSEGLLAWRYYRHELVVVPMVYPAHLYAEWLLRWSELLATLDVPGVWLKEGLMGSLTNGIGSCNSH